MEKSDDGVSDIETRFSRATEYLARWSSVNGSKAHHEEIKAGTQASGRAGTIKYLYFLQH